MCGRTKVCRIVSGFADVSDLGQEWDQLSRRPVEYARASGQHVHVVEHVEQGRAGLVDGAHYSPSLFGEIDQQGDALLYREYVQSAEKSLLLLIITMIIIISGQKKIVFFLQSRRDIDDRTRAFSNP